MVAIYKSDRYLGDLERTEVGEDGIFNGDCVSQVKTASDVPLNDICKMCGFQDSLTYLPEF